MKGRGSPAALIALTAHERGWILSILGWQFVREGMTMTVRTCTLLALLAGIAIPAFGLEPHTGHTWRLSAGEKAPVATIEQVGWLAGSWRGTAFGKTFEEVWSPPSAGTMVGTFKLMDRDTVEFYELMLLDTRDGTLSLRVKHFNADFTAWEDKPDFVHFKLVGIEDDAVHFSGISFYRRDADHIDGYVVMRSDTGIREEKLTYERLR